MIVDIVADLHGCKPALQGGDLLIVAGDLTKRDTVKHNEEFREWIKDQKYTKKIVIAGNHDNLAEKGFYNSKESNDLYDFEYLCDSGTQFRYWPQLKPSMEDGTILEVEDYKIWGIPWTKRFIGMNPKCMAFTFYDENWFYDEKVAQIPLDTDILITHSPPYSILDKVSDGYSVGSPSLFNWMKYVARPKLHVFGHIHEAYGQCEVFPTHNDKMMISINASIMNENYQPVNKPVRVIL